MTVLLGAPACRRTSAARRTRTRSCLHGDKELKGKSKVIKKTLDPEWNEKFL